MGGGPPTYESRCHLQLSQEAKQLLHSTLKNLSPHGNARAAAAAASPCRNPKRAKLKCSKEAPWDMFLVVYLSAQRIKSATELLATVASTEI